MRLRNADLLVFLHPIIFFLSFSISFSFFFFFILILFFLSRKVQSLFDYGRLGKCKIGFIHSKFYQLPYRGSIINNGFRLICRISYRKRLTGYDWTGQTRLKLLPTRTRAIFSSSSILTFGAIRPTGSVFKPNWHFLIVIYSLAMVSGWIYWNLIIYSQNQWQKHCALAVRLVLPFSYGISHSLKPLIETSYRKIGLGYAIAWHWMLTALPIRTCTPRTLNSSATLIFGAIELIGSLNGWGKKNRF